MWIGVDYGKKRSGFACSDALGITAAPCGIVRSPDGPWVKQESFTGVINTIDTILSQKGVSLEGIVLGDPGEDDPGSVYLRRTILQLKESLVARFSCPVLLQDERFSSREAALAREASGRRSGKPLDDAAAAVILTRFLHQGQSGV